ncbi:hypothetical protein ASF70_12955 [Rhizobium sp. Leaf321]|nr:hypothetical protein ASF70_12955 [Rhizobium sp. Leaf321]
MVDEDVKLNGLDAALYLEHHCTVGTVGQFVELQVELLHGQAERHSKAGQTFATENGIVGIVLLRLRQEDIMTFRHFNERVRLQCLKRHAFAVDRLASIRMSCSAQYAGELGLALVTTPNIFRIRF